MPFPPTRLELQRAGYDFIASKTCPCGEAMELWHTPQDKMMPMNPMPADESPAISHWSTCAKAQQFRRASPAAAAMPEAGPEQTQPQMRSLLGEDSPPSPTTAATPLRRTKPNGQR